MKVLVVGAGIMGLSVAWALRRRGHQPVVYEQGPVPNPLGSSVDRSRAIRFPYGGMVGYARMVVDAYAAWDALWRDLGRRHYVETGTLVIARGADDWARRSRDALAALDVPHEELSATRLVERYPFVVADGAGWALFSPTGGVLAAAAIVADLAAHVRARGVAVHERRPVRELDAARAAVRLEDGGGDAADALVAAAGPWAPRLLPGLRGRVTPSRQIVVYLEPPAAYREAWRRAPMVLDGIGSEAHQGGLYVVPMVAGDAIKVGDHGFSLRGEPDSGREPTPDDVAVCTASGIGRLREFDRYRVALARTCFYSVTADERFIAERVERAWVLSGFSGHGFKFGASIGLAVAEAVDGGRSADDLRRYAAGLVGEAVG